MVLRMGITTFLVVMAVVQASPAPPAKIPRQPHDLILCDLKEEDKLLLRTQVKEKAHFFSYVDVDFTYPPPGGYEYKEIIHCIKAFDQVSDGNGGYATVKSGGLNQNAVTINLRSQFNKGIEFILELYGQDPTVTTTTTTAAPPQKATDNDQMY